MDVYQHVKISYVIRFHQNKNLLRFSRRRRLDDVFTTSHMRRTLARENFTSARRRRAISLSMLKVPTVLPFTVTDGVKAAHSDFDRFQLGGGLRPENPSDRMCFRPQLRLYDPCIRTNVSSSKILAHYAENEHFPPPIKRPLLVEAPCDIVIGHCRG